MTKSGLRHKFNLFIVRRHNFQDRHWEFCSPIPPLLSAPRTDVISSVMAISRVLLPSPAWDTGTLHSQTSRDPESPQDTPEIIHPQYSPNGKLPTRHLDYMKRFFSNLEKKLVHWKQPDSAQEEIWSVVKSMNSQTGQIPQEKGWILPTSRHLQDSAQSSSQKLHFSPICLGE